MNNEDFDKVLTLIRLLGTVGLSLAAIVISLAKYFKYLEEKEKQRTIEPRRIKEFLEGMEKIEDRVDNLERDSGSNQIEVRTIKAELKDLVNRLLDNATFRKTK